MAVVRERQTTGKDSIRLKCSKKILQIPEKGVLTAHIKQYSFQARYNVSCSSFRINLGSAYTPLFVGEDNRIKAVLKVYNGTVVLCGLILSLWFLLLFVFSYLACMFISVLYMYAFAFSSLSMFSMFLDMQYSPYSLLYVENAVSTAHLLP